MMSLFGSHRNSLIAIHATKALLIVMAVVGVAALWGFAVADLHELASHWVLRA